MSAIDWEHAPEIAKPTYEELEAMCWELTEQNAELREHVRMPDEPLEIDEKDFYVRAFIKWATEEQPEVKRLEAENEKLQDENERLRSCLSDSAENSKQIMHEAHVQEEENAKLRECLQDLAEHIREDDGFGLDYGWMLDRMRELGVEV